MRTLRTFILPFLLVAVTVTSVAACAQLLTDDSSSGTDFGELSDMVRQLSQSFIDQEKLTEDELNRAAIRGVIEYLDDPYTTYLSPEQYQASVESLEGRETEFEGIGAQVTSRNGEIMILGPLPGSPAAAAGVRPGDVVLDVDGESVEGLELMEAVSLIRGPKGSEVTLRLSRPGEVQPIEITVVRDEIALTSVSARMHDDRIGVIHLEGFDARTVSNLRGAIESLQAEGAEGLILDMRYNPGGLLDAAVGVVSEFIESGGAFTMQEADGTRTTTAVSGEGTAFDIPLVAITNGYTASGAEIVTGALQDHDRAPVIGTRTFGKGSVNLLTRLNSGAGLNVTTARWLTPDGREIDSEGLAPDIEVRGFLDHDELHEIDSQVRSLCDTFQEEGEALEDGRSDLHGALESLCSLEPSDAQVPENDEQLNVAVDTLRSLMDE